MSKDRLSQKVLWRWAAQLAERLGFRKSFNSLCARQSAMRKDRDFRRWRTTANMSQLSPEVTAVILTMSDSPHYDRCRESVERQKLSPASIEIVSDICPFSKASQEALDRVKTPYYLPVDDDMILYPSCFARLYHTITRSSKNGETIAMLMDPFMGEIKGVRMYRTDPVREIGFYPLGNEKGCERNMARALKERGYMSQNCLVVEGEHHPDYQPREAFYKFKLAAEKSRYYKDSISPKLQDLREAIDRYWDEHRDRVAFYAMAGLLSGLESEIIDRELNYADRENEPDFDHAQAVIESGDVDDPGLLEQLLGGS